MRKANSLFWFVAIMLVFTVKATEKLPYPVVDTNQNRCFSNGKEIEYPAEGAKFYGQDAQFQGLAPAYKNNGDGTITDLNTGLMWVKTPDLKDKKTWDEAKSGASSCRVGGYTDWRLPTIKELYSLIDFNGYSMMTAAESVPYLDTKYFDFVYGASRGSSKIGGRVIDAQYWSATKYVGLTMDGNETVFGVNFADGRIKGYPAKTRNWRRMEQFVRYVRGNIEYGKNDFVDNKDGTITDRATGLIWAKADSGKALNWQQALEYANKFKLGGYSDWRLPNAKELQSIVDYTRAPDARGGAPKTAALDPVFDLTSQDSWFWTGTTHLEHQRCTFAVYICFGQGWGHMHGQSMNVHGAGAQRSDPKSGSPSSWSGGHGPQGDEIRIYNYVRCVRGGVAEKVESGPSVSTKFNNSGVLREERQGGGMRDSSGRDSNDNNRGKRSRPGFVSRLDRDNDNKVSRSEFDGPADQFDVLDKNSDGYLSEDEAPAFPPKHLR